MAEEPGVQPTEIGARSERERDGSKEASPVLEKLSALMLIVPGIFLYIYILYILLFKLVYPGSFSPLLNAPKPANFADAAINATAIPDLTHAILVDALLLCVFVAQHSLMACSCLKKLFDDLNMAAITRPLYVCSTCCVIQFIYHFWCPTPSFSIWRLDSCFLSCVLIFLHLVCWLSIACSLFTIDYLELLGLKQIYYSFYGFENPIHYKSEEQQHLLMHLRHPIFVAPVVILWAVPVMTYDRLLVAVMVPLYLGWGSIVDHLDVQYVKEQFHMKKAQLLSNSKVD